MQDDDLNQMLAEIGGTCDFDGMIRCFEAKLAGGVRYVLWGGMALGLVIALLGLRAAVGASGRRQ